MLRLRKLLALFLSFVLVFLLDACSVGPGIPTQSGTEHPKTLENTTSPEQEESVMDEQTTEIIMNTI